MVTDIVEACFLSFRRCREQNQCCKEMFSGVILCTARMLTYHNGQRRSSGTGGAVAVPLVENKSRITLEIPTNRTKNDFLFLSPSG